MNFAEYTNTLINDKRKRTILFAAASTILDFTYAIFNLYIGITSLTPWFITMAFYYTLFVIMRTYIVIIERKLNTFADKKKKHYFENKVMKFCGIFLILLIFALSGTVTLMIKEEHTKIYNSIIMITIATFTFYKIIMATTNAIKVKKHQSPLLTTARNINLADALMSILPMQASMIGSFGNINDKQYLNIMTICVGTAIFIALLWIGISMIKNTKKLSL